jgi:hypothetical protein
VIAEHAHVGGRTIVCGDDIISGEEPLEPQRAVSPTGAIQSGRPAL